MYERTTTIERADSDSAGTIGGILATDGEASDGHILNIAGGKLPERAPLLFGHDDVTGTGNLGSWTDFRRFSGPNKGKPGNTGIRGKAQIELGGEGSQQAWRSDIDHMIRQGHIDSFSVRWEETAEPIARVNLPSDHFARVDPKKATGRQRWGLYFDKWRLLEGSVVTLGADPAALVGRMQQSEGDVRGYWRQAINRALTEANEVASGLVALQTGTGLLYIEREAYDAMLEEANRRLSVACDVLEDARAVQTPEPVNPFESRDTLRSVLEMAGMEVPDDFERAVISWEPGQSATFDFGTTETTDEETDEELLERAEKWLEDNEPTAPEPDSGKRVADTIRSTLERHGREEGEEAAPEQKTTAPLPVTTEAVAQVLREALGQTASRLEARFDEKLMNATGRVR